MIIGDCPDCNGPLMTPIAPHCPAFSKETCEHCGKQHWLYHSRIDPMRYSMEGFADLFEVNEATREIKRKTNQKSH